MPIQFFKLNLQTPNAERKREFQSYGILNLRLDKKKDFLIICIKMQLSTLFQKLKFCSFEIDLMKLMLVI